MAERYELRFSGAGGQGLITAGIILAEAASIIEAEMEATPERDEILEFIKNAKRGIMKGYLSNN